MAEMIETDVKRLVKQQLQRGNVDDALRTLRGAIAVAAAELADLHCILGGAHRQKGDLVTAASAYDDGFEIDARYGAPTTYNAPPIGWSRESCSLPSRWRARASFGTKSICGSSTCATHCQTSRRGCGRRSKASAATTIGPPGTLPSRPPSMAISGTPRRRCRDSRRTRRRNLPEILIAARSPCWRNLTPAPRELSNPSRRYWLPLTLRCES